MSKDLTRVFIDEIYSKTAMKTYPTNEIKFNHIDKIWSIDLANFYDYKISINKGYRYVFVINDTRSEYTWCILLQNKNSQIVTNEFSNILTTSKRSPLKI